jgi:hypothetical protein
VINNTFAESDAAITIKVQKVKEDGTIELIDKDNDDSIEIYFTRGTGESELSKDWKISYS